MFKIGDKVKVVKCVGSVPNLHIGKIGKVINVYDNYCYYPFRVEFEDGKVSVFHKDEVELNNEQKSKFKVGEVYGCNFNSGYRYDCLEVNEEHGYCMFKSNDGLFVSTDLNGSFHNYNEEGNLYIIEIPKFEIGDCVRVIKNTWESERECEDALIGSLMIVNRLPFENQEGYVVYGLTYVYENGATTSQAEYTEEELELVAKGKY